MSAYANPIDALADPTRRRVFELLRSGPASVAALARELPVSRPAVSQHLRTLRDAGLVTFRREGTRHVYAVDRAGVAELRSWLDTFWDDALERFREAAATEGEDDAMIEVIDETLAPIEKTVVVACSVERAFELFTRDIGRWWPVSTHSIHGDAVESLVWEPSVGGEVYEVSTAGDRRRWATVTAWEPPHRLVLSWEVDPRRLGTEVEVRFTELAAGTRVELEHRGFENVAEGAEMRASYDPGWTAVLSRFETRDGA